MSLRRSAASCKERPGDGSTSATQGWEHRNVDGDRTRELASALGVGPEDLLRELGEFVAVEVDETGDGITSVSWWGSGRPLQVLLGVDVDGRVWVAAPRIAFAGPIPVTVAHRPNLLQEGAERRAHVDRVALRTRRRFRYCRQCRTAFPPEYFNTDLGVCDGCASSLGVVF